MRPLFVVVALAAAAGCLEEAQPRPPDPVYANGGDTPVATSAFAPSSFSWSSDDVRGEAGLLVRVDVPETTACRFAGGLAQSTAGNAVRAVFAVHGERVEAWSVTSPTSDTSLHVAGLIDTREERSSAGHLEAHKTTIEVPTMRGVADVVVLGRNLEAWPSQVLDGASLLVHVECDGAFHIVSLHTTRTFAASDSRSIGGGVGAHIEPGASLALFDEASARAVGDRGYFVWGSIGGAGLLTLEHPRGTERWTVESPATQTFTGDPGDYRATIERVGADLDYFFAALVGFDDVTTLDALAQSAK